MAAVCLAGLSTQALGEGGWHARRAPPPVTLEWVGDIALSTHRGLPPGGLRRALAPVLPQLGNADLTLGNLEGTLSVGGSSKCGGIGGGNCFAFQAPPATARSLAGLGFDVVASRSAPTDACSRDTGSPCYSAAGCHARIPATRARD